ncbi:amidohydrolase family protein [Allomuricauda sp. F6463D]|uniref:amidohydrolase family protein n=1 Tax=Allomuricauda sp. F6463D TaxID=2926409 RepID=UPI001FF5061E|nr:amidohydrolase family protein [Muricauda sp. F6463D]MCK0159114.1 amidohydrolase family protein [Muricauda sp. F6463D]
MRDKRNSGYLLILCVMFYTGSSYTQETFPKNDVLDDRPTTVAFTNATIITAPAQVMENAMLLIQNGKIVSVQTENKVPKGYREIDLRGRYIYPSFIDMFGEYGQPEVKRAPFRSPFVSKEQIQPNTKGPYNANEAIKSQYNSSKNFIVDKELASKWRAQGFGSVATIKRDGVARGTAALVALGEDTENNLVIKSKVADHYSFDKGSSTQDYPISSMGTIALLRQTLYDAKWYESHTEKPFLDLSLDALIANKHLPKIMDTDGWLTALRANKIADEFGFKFIIKGGGDEYQRIVAIKNMKTPMIIPIDFPKAYDVSDPYITNKINLADLKHWELAPTNPASLEQNSIPFAITSFPPENLPDFLKNLRKSVTYGLSKTAALSSLTTVPAKLLGVDHKLGTLEVGKIANFIITDGDLFQEGTQILDHWIVGKPYVVNNPTSQTILGEYNITVGTLTAILSVTSKASNYQAELTLSNGTTEKVDFKMDGKLPVLQFTVKGNQYNLKGWSKQENSMTVLNGTGTLNFEENIQWMARKTKKGMGGSSSRKVHNQSPTDLGEVYFPFLAFGSPDKIESQSILITNVTVWTNEEEGILTNSDVLIENGKIAKIGNNLSTKDILVVDGTGKHLTAGIIDEHSHIALGGINEIAPNSGMVRMQDVINPDDPGIYRALAGGVVAAQLLHGSSDPIGGQSALVKLKWGSDAKGMLIQDADHFIKFALGENVKRSRSQPSIRFPRSLMGLEQFYTNAFNEALDYKKQWNAYYSLGTKEKRTAVEPRKNILHETMLEILEKKRFITAHSYQQKEMLMLMEVAERFGFALNTFTHAMEGYRIADRMMEHGVGGSTFSDRWNYKWEARNGTPYNAPIMDRVGVVTALNSDSGETMRHLNHEAAKMVRYGGISPEEALKMITLNPAKLLHLDDTMGSIKVGKSADVVLWTGDPLSLYSKPEKTIIEGAIYFDLAKNEQLRRENLKERSRLLKKLEGLEGVENISTRISLERVEFHCESLEMQN